MFEALTLLEGVSDTTFERDVYNQRIGRAFRGYVGLQRKVGGYGTYLPCGHRVRLLLY